MKKIINYLKRLFSNKPRFKEKYTLNKMYQDNAELKRFIQERQYHCEISGIEFTIIEDDFPDDQYGKVELLRNGKIIDKAELIKRENDLIYWKFDE